MGQSRRLLRGEGVGPLTRPAKPAVAQTAAPIPVDVPKYSELADSATLMGFWIAVRRQKLVILLTTAACVACAYLMTRIQQPVYRARAVLEVQSLNENFLNLQQLAATVGTPGDNEIETQSKLLLSDSLRSKVVRELTGGAAIRPRDNARVAAVEFAAGSLLVQPMERTRVIQVTSDSPDPRVAAEFANKLTEEFIETGLDSRMAASRHLRDWLNRQLGQTKEQLAQSERELQAYAGRTGLVLKSDQQSTMPEEKLRKLQQDLAMAQTERLTRQSRYELAKSSPPDALSEVLDSDTIRGHRMRINDLRQQLSELEASFTPEYYKVQRAKAQLTTAEAAFERERATILQRIENEYREARQREALLLDAYQKQAREVSGHAAETVQYDVLRHDVETNRQLYQSMLQRVREATIASALRASNVRVIDPATVPAVPFKPNVRRTVALGFLAGLFLGAMVALARRGGEQRIQQPADVSNYLDVPEIGVVVSDGSNGRARLRVPGRSVPRLVASEPGEAQSSVMADSLRTAVTSFWMPHNLYRVVVFASPNPGDGKTTVVSNLGVALTAVRKRVLLVDGDLRNPTLHKVFKLPAGPGLMDLLRDPQKLEDIPDENIGMQTANESLMVLPAGSGGAELDLLYSDATGTLMRRLRRAFDAVLIDTPAIMHLVDARVLGSLADGVILVLRADKTDRDDALQARQRFVQDGIPVLGAILNDWRPGSKPYTYYNKGQSRAS